MSILAFLAFLAVGCSSIDCTLSGSISARYMVHTLTDTLHDTLTVRAIRLNRQDTTLLNRIVNKTYFNIPVSYGNAYDQLQLLLTDTTHTTITDTVTLYKTDIPHFESVDCSPTFFHTITDVKWTNNAIDSIIVSKPNINYDTSVGHLHIYFKPGH